MNNSIAEIIKYQSKVESRIHDELLDVSEEQYSLIRPYTCIACVNSVIDILIRNMCEIMLQSIKMKSNVHKTYKDYVVKQLINVRKHIDKYIAELEILNIEN